MRQVWEQRPFIDDHILERWPTPAEVSAARWDRLSLRARHDWLVEHAFVEQDGRWVPRPELDETGQQVVEATDLLVDVRAFVDDHFAELEEDIREGLGNEAGEGDSIHIFAGSAIRTIALIVLLVLVGAAFVASTFGDDDPPEVATEDGDSSADSATPVVEPSELEQQDPVELTSVRWRFYRSTAQEHALYEITFEEDGTCFVADDPLVYGGEYTVDGIAVEITLHERHELEATNPADGDVRTATLEADDWFHMTRIGNAMYGTAVREGWQWSYDRGIEPHEDVVWTDIFARPRTPGD